MLQLLRKARPPDPGGRRPWIEQATAASERRARAMDELENLSDDELRRRRDDLVYKATAARSDQQQAAAEMLEDLEAVAEARGIEPREENYSGSAYIPKRVNLRARIEAGIRLHGSFKRVIDEIKLVDTSSGTAADLEFFQAEMNAFKAEFRGRARQTAIDMLTGSVTAIRTIVTAYGLPWDMTKLAAQDLARTGDLDKEIDDVVELAAKKSDIDDPRYEKQRLELRNNARHLKQLQDKVAKKAAVEEQNLAQYRNDPAGFEREHGAAARAADKELTAARDEFQRAWVEAEWLHPVLTALRRHGELEEISLDKLAGASIEDEMHAVLAEVVPKLRDAGRAAAMLRDKHLDPLTLPSVVALTRATMFIPKGSLRDGAINDAVSEAAHADSWLLQLAVFALAAVTFLPSAGASLGVAAGIGAIGLAAHSAVEEWELYSTQKVLSNTHIDLARSLATEEPSLTGFALSLAGLGLELLPLAGAFNRARKLRKLVFEGKEATADARRLIKELDEIGGDHGAPDLGKRALAEIHGTPRPRAGTGTPPSGVAPRTEEEVAQTLGKGRQTARPYNRRPPKGAPAPRVGPHVPVKPAAQRMVEAKVTKAAFDATEAGVDNWAQFLNYSKVKGHLKDVDLSKLTKAEIKELRKAYNEGAAAARKLGQRPPRPPKAPLVGGPPRVASIPAPAHPRPPVVTGPADPRTLGRGGIDRITQSTIGNNQSVTVIEGRILQGVERHVAKNYNEEEIWNVLREEAGLSGAGTTGWPAAHLWGPGRFGDEAAAGMLLAPHEVNELWHNKGIETFLQEAAEGAARDGGHVYVRATSISHPGDIAGGAALQSSHYEFWLVDAQGNIRELGYVKFSVKPPPASGSPASAARGWVEGVDIKWLPMAPAGRPPIGKLPAKAGR